MFDINKAIKESRISKSEIKKLEKTISHEFPNDRMMYELHFIRALRSLQNKKSRFFKPQTSSLSNEKRAS